MTVRPPRAAHLLLPILIALAACGGDPAADREVIKPIASAATAGDPAAAAAGAPAAGPVNGPAGAAAGGAGLAFDLPESWEEEPPANAMRLAQARIPGAGGAGPGELAVFYFGPGGGGGVDANIERWLGQVEPEAGTTPERESFDQGGLTVHTVAARGTVTPSPMSMRGGPQEPQPGQMLLGAVIEGPGGPWFFKATGPAETLADHREAFLAMVRSARADS